MHRIFKWLWIIFILCVVVFIICDEKWYKIWYENGHIFFSKTVKESDLNSTINTVIQDNILYKDSNIIRIYPGFENPILMYKSAGLETWFIALLNQSKYNRVSVDSNNSISNILLSSQRDTLKKYNISRHTLNLYKAEKIIQDNKWNWLELIKYEWSKHIISLRKWKNVEKKEIILKKYEWNTRCILNLKKWKEIEPLLENTLIEISDVDSQENESVFPNSILKDLLLNDDIDVQTLESENDEFLQKIFEETRDTSIMNLIVENYLKEYQFLKAKRFVENLPQIYRDDLKPSLNLRLSFNSFSLSSKTVDETLKSLIETYQLKNMILAEDEYRYLWILSLMQQDYDNFFELANNFTSDNHKSFAAKIQWYKDQISKQMWMPKYYFDTLVALELFNQWLFQPAKVLALYSLQQNTKYILPYQILAYSNFLTNSRDTSIEYLKKLIDLDPNNEEKYRFLMWIAYYRNEKYEQSVVMLSLIQNEKLRLDTQRYLINNYIKLDQKNKLISSWNKLLWYDNLVASDFYTYFYETFYHPYSEWSQYQLYAFDTELANKMIRVCAIRLPLEEKAVCNYGNIGKNIALWQFDWLEQSLLNLTSEYPQWYLYHALGEYYIKQWDLDKAKAYLIKAVSMAQKKSEIMEIKKLLQSAI